MFLAHNTQHLNDAMMIETDPALGRPDNNVKYLDAYSEEISTRYSQVWWTMGPIYNFSDEVIKA